MRRRLTATTVEATQHDRLTHLRGANPWRALKIGNRPRNFQHPGPGARRKSEAFHRRIEQPPSGLIGRTAARHVGIRKTRIAATLTGALDFTRRGHRRRRGVARGLPGRGRGELGSRQPRNLHVQIKPIQERRGDARAVALHLRAGAAAITRTLPETSARTGVHGGDELKGRGVLHL